MFFRVVYRLFVDPSNTARSPYLIARWKRRQRIDSLVQGSHGGYDAENCTVRRPLSRHVHGECVSFEVGIPVQRDPATMQEVAHPATVNP